jgi:MFS transporter, Spinster family, sphingosine-1-phosphate transporter
MNTSAAPGISRGRAYYGLSILTLINLLNYLDRYLVPPLYPAIQKEFRVDYATVGWLGSVFVIVYMVFAPVAGIVGDRYPRRLVLAAGVMIWSLATFGGGFAMTFFHLLLARAIVGVGEAGYGTVAPGLIADLFRRTERSRMLAYFYVAIPVGSALGFWLGGRFVEHYSWHHAFWIAGLPGVLIALMAFAVPEPKRGATDEGPPPEKVPFAVGMQRLRKNGTYWTAVAGLTLMTFSIGGLANWMPSFLQVERGIGPERAGYIFGAITASAGLVGTLVGGWLGDIADRRSTTGGMSVSGWGLLGAVPFMAICALAQSHLVIFGAIAVAQFLIFLNNGPLNAAIVSAVPADIRSFAVGISVFAYHALGDAISPPVIGEIATRSSLATAILLNAVPVALGGLILVVGARLLHQPAARAAVAPASDTG